MPIPSRSAWSSLPALLLLLAPLLGQGGARAASLAPVAAPNGMVVTAQHHATRVGVAILAEGGNAIDAAVAVGYALAVVYPAAGNLGGGGFMTLRLADGRKTFIDFRETAPAAASADMYLGPDGKPDPMRSVRGHLAVAVPGTVAGLELARQRYGTLPRATLVEPAYRLARRGFVLEAGDVALLAEASADFRRDPASAAIFLDRQGQPWPVGHRLLQRDLARTLQRIARAGAAGFYAGPVAAALVASSQAGGGIIATADLAAYQALERVPVECDYRGYQVISAPPPSAGGVVLCEMLNILEGYPLAELGHGAAEGLHYQIEAMRHAYVDRNSALGDPAFVDNPLERLLSDDYAAAIRARIDPQQAADSATLGPGTPPHGGSNTTHYSIADRHGNVVAVTYTLNDWFGARVTAAGTGVLLNDEMDDFTAQPGAPNLYGLVQGEANRIEPGKRPLSSMTPTIVLDRDGEPLLVLGTPGGSRIISAVLLTMLNVLDYGMDIQEAVDAPRFHQQWQPPETWVEPRAFSPDTRALLEARGHRFTVPQPDNHLAAILIGAPAVGAEPVGRNRYYGANDPRRGTGLAAGH